MRKLAEDGASQREIARKLALNRRTVAKMLATESPPRLSPRHRGSQLDPLMGAITKALTSHPGIHAPQLAELLRATHGYRGSVDLVRRRLAQLRSADPGLAPPPGPRAGHAAEWDWVKLHDPVDVGAGARRHVWVLLAWLPFSGVQTSHFTLDATLESFLEGHVRILAWLGGVPTQCRYDHLLPVVAKRDGRGAMRWHRRFRELRRHYGFTSSVYTQQQAESTLAGAVERLRGDFWPTVRFTSLRELDEAYARWREDQLSRGGEAATGGASTAVRLTEERRAMRRLPREEFAFARQRTVRVPLDGYVRHGACFYRAPPAFAGQRVELHASRDEVWMAWRDEHIVTYPRSYKSGLWLPTPPG